MMRKGLVFTLVAVVLVFAVTIVLAETREYDFTEVTFGGSFHKSIGIHLKDLRAVWGPDGITHISYYLSPWKGMIVYEDMLVVNGNNTIYRLSDHRQLNVQMHYQLTAKKFYQDKVYIAPAVGPFDYDNGQIWWIIGYEEGGVKKKAAVIWSMKTNEITWKPYKD